MKTVETVNVKQLASHELSVEQQLYFKEITEVGGGIVAVPENFEPDPVSGKKRIRGTLKDWIRILLRQKCITKLLLLDFCR